MSAKYKSPSFLLPNELNTSANTANDTGINSLYSMNFDGNSSSSSIDLGVITELDGLTNFSFSIWFTRPNQDSGDNVAFGNRDASNAGKGIALSLVNGLNSYLYFIGPGSGAQWNEIPNSLLNTGWNHIVTTYDGTTLKSVVNNGTPITDLSSRTLVSTTNFRLGNDGTLNSGLYSKGKLDEFCIFNKTISDQDIEALWNNGSPASAATVLNLDPFAYYPLGEQAQNTGYLDPSNPGSDISGSEWQFPNGVLQDYVMDFNGSDDFVQTSGFTIGNNYSFSCWLKSDTTSPTASVFLSSPNYYSAGYNGNFIIRFSNSTTIQMYSFDGTANSESSAATIPAIDTNWHHFFLTSNGTTTKIYWDGSPLTVTGNQTKSLDNLLQGLIIGYEVNFGNNPFSGQISNVAVWNSDQTANVANIYNNGSPQTTYTVTPQNWWKLNADSVYTPSAPNYTTALDYVNTSSPTYGNYSNNTSSIISGNADRTISFWYKTNSAGLNPNEYAVSLGDLGNSATSTQFSIALGPGSPNPTDNTFFRLYGKGNDSSTIYIKYLGDQKYHHIVISYSSLSANVYVDGESQGAVTFPSGTPLATTSGINIGKSFQAGSNGNVSNVAVYDSALTASQVSTLFNFGTPETSISFNPLVWYKLDNKTTGSQSNGSLTGSSYDLTHNGTVNEVSSSVAVVPSWKIPSALPITTPNYTAALDFNGSSNYIDVPNVYDSIKTTNIFTISTWFITDLSHSTSMIFGRDGYAGSYADFACWIQQSGQVLMYVGGSAATTSIGTITANTWINAVFVFKNTGTGTHKDVDIYINGSPVAVTQTANAMPNTSYNLRIGGAATYRFKGSISNVAVFNSALTSPQVSTLYNNGTPETAISFSPIGWWKLDTGGSTITDYGSAGNNGTNSSPGATQVTSDVVTPQPVNGVSTTLPSTALQQSDLQFDSPYSNYSLKFDGTGDYINCGNSLNFVTSNYSLSFWIKTTSTTNLVICEKGANDEIAIQTLTSGNIRWAGTNSFDTSGVNVSDNNWHHLVFVANGSSSFIYIDGSLNTTGGNKIQASSNTDNFYIGSRAGLSGFNGQLDETSLFNYALSSAKVLEIYNNGKPSDLDNFSGTAPISWWRLGENAYFDNNTFTVPNSITGAPNGTGAGTVTSMLSADAPGTYANGVGTNLDIVDRVGDAPLSTANSQSYNMIPDDKVPYVPGYVGAQISNTSEMTFDGVDDIFDLSSEVLFDSTKSFSVSAWVKLTGYSPSLYPSIAKFKTDTSTGWTFGLSNASAYAGVFFGSSTNFARGRTDGDISADFIGVWKHICLVFDGVDKAALSSYKIYVDGSNIGLTGAGAFSTVSNTSSVIGGQPGNKFNGQIDEVAIFDKALTADQIKFDLYNATTTGKTADIENNTNLPTPVAWYRMGD